MDNVRFLENKFSKEIKKHISKALPNLQAYFEFRPSTDEEDCNLSFDLVFSLDFTISVRIRKFKYLNYSDLTIRSKSKNNGKTEIDKIMEGKAQVYFYAYMNEEENKLIKVRIANVESIRKLTTSNIYTHRKNNDQTEFYAYSFENIKKMKGNIYKYDI
tara:strand:+ start:459 stop:935 length:477 start_codon:yes stop_codon:yes gene_type:complete